MSCPMKTYPLSPAESPAICDKLFAETGIRIDPTKPAGIETDSKDHITIAYSIHDGQIDINVTSKPWEIPCSLIFSQLDELFASK